MKAEVEIIKPGLFSTIQDLGRTGNLKYGVPLSGAMDGHAAMLANLSLQNPKNAAVLEITQLGPTLKFSAATRIALFGADLAPAINDVLIENNKAHRIMKGDVLSFGRRKEGCRVYLAIYNGFKSERILGSRSWYEGITPHFRLEPGMRIPFDTGKIGKSKETYSKLKVDFDSLNSAEIDVFQGPEFKFLPEATKNALFSMKFSIGKQNNRMAIQFQETLQNRLKSIITGPVLPGTVQLTPSGTVIVLMRDCQTTGGYPRILQVSEQGINRLSQKIMGDEIRLTLNELK